jgi:hypothetical protein
MQRYATLCNAMQSALNAKCSKDSPIEVDKLKMHVGLALATVSIPPPPADAKYAKLKQLKQKAKQQNNAVFSLRMEAIDW